MGTRAEPSPWLVALLAAVAGAGGAWLAGVSGGGEAPPAPAPPGAEAPAGPLASGPGEEVRPGPSGGPAPTLVSVWATAAGAPAAGAELELHLPRTELAAPLLLARGTLDAQGHAGLALGPGPYLVTVRQGRAAASQAFEVAAGHAQQLLLALGETWTARLTVVGAGSGRPLRDAEASLEGPPTGRGGAAPPARGDGLGRVELAGLAPGPARVRVSAPEALPATVELAPGDGEPEVVALEPAAFVAGTVLDENGTVLPGVRVGTGGGLDEDRTDAAGRFRAPCRPGDVVVVAIDPAGRSASARVAVAPGATATGVVLRLGAPHRLTGVVTHATDGGSVAGALVRAEAFSGVEVARTVSSAGGGFELDGLPAGWVNVRAQLGRGARGAALGVATDGAEPVRVPLEAAAALWGVVSGGPGQPVAGAAVRVARVGPPEPAWTAVSDTEGVFRLEDLPAGAVRLEAALEGEAASGAARAVLEAGAATRVDLAVGRDGTLEGTVRGLPGRRLVVGAFGGVEGERLPRLVPVGAGGRYRLRLPAGRWQVSAHAEGARHFQVEGEVVAVEAGRTLSLDLEAREEAPEEAAARDDAFSVEAGTLGASFDGAGGEVRLAWLSARGPAARAGLETGEVLLAVDGLEVHDSLQAFERTRGAPGSTVRLLVRGTAGTRTVELRRQPVAEAARRAAAP